MATTRTRDEAPANARIDRSDDSTLDRSSNDVSPYKRQTDRLFKRYGTPVTSCATHRQ